MQSSRAEQEAVGHRLIENAKRNSLYVAPSLLNTFGERKRKPSGESIVYIDEERGRVVKIKDPFAKAPMKGHAASDAVYEHIVHNLLFPNTRYYFIGISESSFGEVRFVMEQDYLKDGYVATAQKTIDRFLTEKLQLQKEGLYWYGNDYFAITDVDAAGDNVLTDNNGVLFFIDPIIKFKKPAIKIIDNLRQRSLADISNDIRQIEQLI